MWTRRKPEQPRSLDELIELHRKLDIEIAERSAHELEHVKQKLVILAKAQGLSPADVFGFSDKEPRKRKKREVKAKYQHPDDPSLTWSGRGKPPMWMRELLDNGAPKETLTA